MQSARKQALEFATPLFDMEPMRAENLDKLAKDKGLVVRATAPFDLQDGPKELEVGPDFAQKAFARTPDDPFAGPILGLDGAYIIGLVKSSEARFRRWTRSAPRLRRTTKLNQALNLARMAGTVFYQTLTNGLAQGNTVAAICAEAKLQFVEAPPFSLSTRELPSSGGASPAESIQTDRVYRAAGKGQPLPDDCRWRRHCLCEVQAAAGRGANEREPSDVRQLCPPEPAKRGV